MGLVSNGTRAMLVLMEHEGDAGFHAVDPKAASDAQGGYVLDNGQVDTYADRDTVPVDDAVRAVAVLVRTGERDDGIDWRCKPLTAYLLVWDTCRDRSRDLARRWRSRSAGAAER